MVNNDPNHVHTYDAQGRMTCCSLDEKIYTRAGAEELVKNTTHHKHDHASHEHHDHAHRHDDRAHSGHDHGDGDGHNHDHDLAGKNVFRLFLPALVALCLLLAGIVFDYVVKPEWFSGWIRLAWYAAAYLPVGMPVIRDAFMSIKAGELFSEFLLMTIATVGAFVISEYPEGVAVMLFYAVGEVFQTLAVSRAKSNINALLDQRPDEVTVLRNGKPETIKAADAQIGDTIQLKPGEKLGLDGELLSDTASFNTAALTGESKPDTKNKGEVVLAGMLNLNTVSLVNVTTAYTDSKLSKILELVQHATARKAPTELFIRKFARVYTPIVVLLAVAICVLPFFFAEQYHFQTWLYRALVFLVISCPCALVISIPLGYFGGIGAASRNGILFKGSYFLDILASVQQVVMDKTGTITEGVFNVQEVHIEPGFNQDEILKLVNAVESHSTHPVATAIHAYAGHADSSVVLEKVEEIAGRGLKAVVDGKELLVGNFQLLDAFGINYQIQPDSIADTVVAVAYGNAFAGYLTIADKIKADAPLAVDQLKAMGIKTTMLSGDKSTVVQRVAASLGITRAFGDLLPEDKVNKVKELKAANQSVAYVGDGVNDAPVVALSDAGIAMGGLGSDATIETADVVIQDDMPSKIPMAIRIGRKTKQIVWQNITLAFAVKAVVLILGAGGVANMWEAVFADVGVALLAILNAVRIQKMKF